MASTSSSKLDKNVKNAIANIVVSVGIEKPNKNLFKTSLKTVLKNADYKAVESRISLVTETIKTKGNSTEVAGLFATLNTYLSDYIADSQKSRDKSVKKKAKLLPGADALVKAEWIAYETIVALYADGKKAKKTGFQKVWNIETGLVKDMSKEVRVSAIEKVVKFEKDNSINESMFADKSIRLTDLLSECKGLEECKKHLGMQSDESQDKSKDNNNNNPSSNLQEIDPKKVEDIKIDGLKK